VRQEKAVPLQPETKKHIQYEKVWIISFEKQCSLDDILFSWLADMGSM